MVKKMQAVHDNRYWTSNSNIEGVCVLSVELGEVVR